MLPNGLIRLDLGEVCSIATMFLFFFLQSVYYKMLFGVMLGECDKNWASSPLANHRTELNGNHSSLSTPSTVSPSPEATLEEDISKMSEMERREELRLVKDFNK